MIHMPGICQLANFFLLLQVNRQEAVALLPLEYIIIFSRTSYEHIYHVQQALALLHDANVTLNKKKYKRFTNRIYSIGHDVNDWRHMFTGTPN